MHCSGARLAVGLAIVIAGVLCVGCAAPATSYPAATPTLATVSQVAPDASATEAGPLTRPAARSVTSSPAPRPAPTEAPAPLLPPTMPPPLSPSPAPPTASMTPSPAPPDPTSTPTAEPTARPSATRPPATAAPAPTATYTRLPPAPTSPPYLFLPSGSAQPDPSHPCPGCPRAPAYIVGHIVDAAGNPLAGVRLVCYNEWYRYPIVASKGGGEYDFPITQAETTWYVVVLDEADGPISPEVAVPFHLSESCRYILNWQRAN